MPVLRSQFPATDLSRDHVHQFQGGQDDWTNVVTVQAVHTRKGNRLLSECSMELLALPYRPNRAEYLALTHSGRILGIKWRFSVASSRVEAGC